MQKKAFDKIKHSFRKSLRKIGIKGILLNLIKIAYKNPQVTLHLMLKD